MKGIVATFIVVVLGLAVKKPLLLHFYLQLAVGRTTKLLRFLQKVLTGNGKNDDETERQIAWVHRQELRKTEIISRDGLTLTGYYMEHPKAERIVLMFHGWRGVWDKDCAALAHGLFEKNSSVLMVNQRAHGCSEGKYIGFGVLERYDCQDWIAYLNEHTNLPVYLSGVSMGASTVLMAAGEKLPDCVKGVIADCGFTSPYEMVKIFARKFMHMKERKAEDTVDEVNHLCKKKVGYDLRDYSTVEAMHRCKIPVFFAHGTDDHFVPYEMTVKNYEACAGRKTLYTAEGASHTKSYITGPGRYMEALAEFFQWEPAYQV